MLSRLPIISDRRIVCSTRYFQLIGTPQMTGTGVLKNLHRGEKTERKDAKPRGPRWQCGHRSNPMELHQRPDHALVAKIELTRRLEDILRQAVVSSNQMVGDTNFSQQYAIHDFPNGDIAFPPRELTLASGYGPRVAGLAVLSSCVLALSAILVFFRDT